MAFHLRHFILSERYGRWTVFDITRFTLADMTRCGAQLRELGGDASSIEEACGAIVRYLYDNICDAKGRACVLVRMYKTHPYGELPDDLREFGQNITGAQLLTSDTKCLTLLGTVGDEPQWNDRHASQRHRSIPLPSKDVIEHIPMIAQMARQFGIEISSLLETRPEIIRDLDQKTYNVFYVPQAHDSPFIPAQEDFVIPYRVKSALGFGGVLPTGNLFAVIMFTRVTIPIEAAQMFRTVALNVKMNMLRFAGRKVFADSSSVEVGKTV
jgi:two-component system, NtrC family, sensor kinase